MKQIRFLPNVPLEIRAIPQPIALGILKALHRYIETGAGRVKPLSGEFEGLLRLRVGNYRVLFDETAETVTLHRVRDSKERLQLKNTGRQAGQPSRVVQILRIAAAHASCKSFASLPLTRRTPRAGSSVVVDRKIRQNFKAPAAAWKPRAEGWTGSYIIGALSEAGNAPRWSASLKPPAVR